MTVGRRQFMTSACAAAAGAAGAAGALGTLGAAPGPASAPVPRETPENQATPYKLGKVLYRNALASESDIEDFRLEGQAKFTFPNRRLRVENVLDPSLGQKANFVYWCPADFPDNVAFSWEFSPLKEPGLCMFFFSATGRNGEDLFDPKLAPRSGEYRQYHHGDINALHASYFRRNAPKSAMQLNLCNLRKSWGFHLVAQGPDPIPSADRASPPYRIQVVKIGPRLWFNIQDILCYQWTDDGKSFGPLLGRGKIGFRQMAPMVAEYANLQVRQAELA